MSVADHESRIAELEVKFSRPESFRERSQLAASGERYRVLKEEVQALWDEWETLSLEAENVDSKLAGLQVG